MSKYFITGGSGFIGSHLTDTLLAEGHEVTVYDSLVTGRASDLAQHHSNPRFKFVKGDILDQDDLRKAMVGHETVWHLAANTIMQGSGYGFDLNNNVLGTWNVLEAMRKLDIPELLFSSTSAVYGDIPGEVLPETTAPLHPISLYGATKLACEPIISAYSHLFDIDAWIFRFSNVVGGGMGHGVIYDFIQKLRRNPAELEIWGDGKGRKCYFLVEDCISAMRCMYRTRRAEEHPVKCDITNIGGIDLISVDLVAEIVMEEMGLKNVKIRYTGGRHGFPGDVPSVEADVSKLLSHGWWPSMESAQATRACARRLIHNLR